MSSLIKKIAPIALQFIPGVGTLAGAALGAGIGAMGGGGLKGALLGGAGGALGASGGGLGSSVGSSISKAVGLGGQVGSQTIGSALSGGLLGASTGGGLKSALIGGVTGGLGANAGDISRGLVGSAATKPLAAGVQGASAPATSGILASGGGGGIGNALSSSLSGTGAGTLAGAANSYMTADSAEEDLLKAQRQSQEALQPWLSAGQQGLNELQSGFDSSNLQNDAGYQFRLQEGNKALERSLAARGLGDSGAALKAAQDYGQGLASQSYNDSYNQWLQRNSGLANYGSNATSGMIDTYGNVGNISANSGTTKGNILTGTLSNILGRKSYIDANGKVVYLDEEGV